MITIIIPVYNIEKYLSQCLESVINQTYTNLEIILVDDGSTDGSSQICDDYARRDSRIKVIHKQNAGVSSARNAGLNAANGKYIGFVDSDDIISCNMYCILHDIAEKSQADIIICSHDRNTSQIAAGQHDEISFITQKGMDIFDRLLFSAHGSDFTNISSLCNKLFNRRLFDNVRFPEGRVHEDDTIIPVLLMKAENITTTDIVLYHYRNSEGSIINTDSLKKRIDLSASRRDWVMMCRNMSDKYRSRTALLYYFSLISGSNYQYKRNDLDGAVLICNIIKKDRKLYYKYLNKYDKICILMLLFGMDKILLSTGFEPVQSIIRRLRKRKYQS